ncbi:MAG TPA: methyltransferase domain-containing protein [Usitatibacter sp.]|nr:methyltransferase domain-containing protein [Usitatibacter sp.]
MRYDDTDQARRYDAARAMSRETQRRSLEPLRPLLPDPIRLVVDLGCGTGRFTAALADEFGAPVCGIDPAETMLAKARVNVSHPRVTFTRAEAAAIPLPAGAADLVFVSMAYHHFEDKPAAAREIRRVLAPGGLVALRNTTVDALDGFAFLEYFPAARAHGEAMLPRRDELEATLQDAGLMPVLHEVMPHEMARSWAEYCDKIAARAYSLLAMIMDAEFEAGLAAMRGARGRPGPIVEPIDFFAFRA